MPTKSDYEKITRKLVDEGKLIEAGWLGLMVACDLEDAPEIQKQEMRNAFFAGAQHVYTSILTMLDPGAEPTDKDLDRMEQIDLELKHFINDFTVRYFPTEGSS